MIPIKETVMQRLVNQVQEAVEKIMQTDEFVDFVKELYRDETITASCDIAVAMNYYAHSCVARPIYGDIVDKNGKVIDGLFVDIDNEIYDIYGKKYYDVTNGGSELVKNNSAISSSISKNHYKLIEYFGKKLGEGYGF